jgi:hypothetical protein
VSEGSESIIPATTSPNYELPLGFDAFERALQRGHGRAYLHAIGHDTPANLLVHALTHNLRYDRQCEEAAQDWYVAMASHHPDASSIFEQVIAWAEGSKHSDHKHYMAGTLARMHRDGNPQALRALYTLTSNPDTEYSPPVPGMKELIEIEGENGIGHVLRTLASAVAETRVEPWMIQHCFAQISDEFAKECVEKLAAMTALDIAFKPLLDTMHGFHDESQKEYDRGTEPNETTLESLSRFSDQQRRDTPASLVIELVRKAPDDNHGSSVQRWARFAPRDALDEIISETLVENDPHRIHKYLRAFTERSPLHRYDQRFAGWLDHPLEKLRWTAHHALATCPDPRVRELALQRTAPHEVAWGSIRMLQSTYQPGDHRAIESALYIPDDPDILHGIGFSLLNVFGQNATPESLGSMLYVYEHGPCMNCRGKAISIMDTAGVLPAWVREESHFDADPQIRKEVSGSEAIPTSVE